MKLLLFILCLFAPFYVTSTLSLDGLTLLSLLNHWTSVPPSLNSSWKSSDANPCSWLGIQCNRYKNVVFLNLTASQIVGHVGPEIGRLTHLQKLLLASNGFLGTIPPELGNCSMLEYIDLSDNDLSGKIPPKISNCKSLKSLHLHSNQLEGEIPNELGRLSKLEDLELYSNILTGEIPHTIWKIQSLKQVLLHNNSLFGMLPLELIELKHLENISLAENELFGSIPQGLGINSSLVRLDFMYNKFTGYIPPNLCFGKQLRQLSLGFNQLKGGIPHDIGRCTTLRRLVLGGNYLSGTIPDFEGDQNLIYMDISNNNISGAIPSSLGNCKNLTALILSMNKIAGFIPSELGNLLDLQALDLAHNNLEGPLPLQLSNCTKMLTFDVGFNSLNGSFPSSMTSWTGLTTLVLRENLFSGDIPSFLSEYDQLLELQLGGNMFVGKIPPSIGSLQNLVYGLNLSANKLTGEIPLEIAGLQKLQSLDVSHNNLTGSIDVLGQLSSLTEINISYNFFVDTFSEWSMKYLNLLPSSFTGNTDLNICCSSSNAFTCEKYPFLKPCVSESSDHKGNKHSFLFIVLGCVVFAICLSVLLIIYYHHYGQRYEEEVFHDQVVSLNDGSTLRGNADWEEQEFIDSNGKGEFRIIDLINATENLHDRFIISLGGHGIVYKAELDFGVFAVKKVKFSQNNRRKLYMIKEMEITKNIRHQNVARCLGFWIGEEFGLTISTYRENGSLHDVLHESSPQPCLAWNVRYKIAIGIAKGLAHLHHSCDPPILHRDIKPKNIILDSNMQPYITDFGISIALNQPSTVLRLRSTYHLGTPGFMAPEIAYETEPRCELDIYGYGVVLLELITRKKVLDSSFVGQETTLVGWFKSIWRTTRKLEEIVDSGLARELSDVNVKAQVVKTLLVALICVQKDRVMRLMKMIDAVEFFETPTDPAILVQHDKASFHLGYSLTTAAASLLFQFHPKFVQEAVSMTRAQTATLSKEEIKIHAKEGSLSGLHEMVASTHLNNPNTIRRGTPGIKEASDLEAAVKKVMFARKLGNILSAEREAKILGMAKHLNIDEMCEDWSSEDESTDQNNCFSLPISLHEFLHEKNPHPLLKWCVSYKIATGIARGLAYLHHDCEPPIVHCAIKPKTILLDYRLKPHIADFGTAKLLFQSSTTPPSSILCTPGTTDLCATTITREFDVYSYGVVLLQMITRKKAIDTSFTGGTEIHVWVRSLWEETGDIHKIIHSSLSEEVLNSNSDVLKQVTQVLSLALRCTEADPCLRPTMEDVMKQLVGSEFKLKSSTRTSQQRQSARPVGFEMHPDECLLKNVYNRLMKELKDSRNR